MLYSIRHSSRNEQNIPVLLVYLGSEHELDLSVHPSGAGFIMLYYCTEGSGEFTLSGERMVLTQGHLFVAFPETDYSCRSLENGCKAHIIGLTGACVMDIFKACGISDPGLYRLSSGEVLEKHINSLAALYKVGASQENYSKICYSLIVDLPGMVHKINAAEGNSDLSDTVKMVIEYLETNYQQPFSLNDLVSQTGLTKEYLCYIFKKEMQHTILHHLTMFRIGLARKYLEQYPDKNVYEIGRMCGFESPSYFGKKFRQIVGITPESYRRVNSVIV